MRILTTLLFLLFSISTLTAQSTGGDAYAPTEIGPDFVVLPGVPAETDGNLTLLVYQFAGASISTAGPTAGRVTDLGGAGRYAIRELARRRLDTFFLSAPLTESFDVAFSQVVVAGTPDRLEVSEDFTARPFDGTTGGVLFLVASDTLLVSGRILADGAGFRGGEGREVDSDCTSFTRADELTYPLSDWRGSPRGESVAAFPSGSLTGRAPVASGGGGGNDHNTGGGGGANVTNGGFGGVNIVPGLSFTCRGNFPGFGGRGLEQTPDRLYFGGGGGTGHANNSVRTGGGNGGGLVVLSAAHLVFTDNATISATGDSAREADGDGAGGGGAAGTIFLHAGTLSGQPSLILVGGAGGSTDNNNQRRCFGPGGGGSGGRLLQQGTATDFSPVTNLSGGAPGRRLDSDLCGETEEAPEAGTDGVREVLGEAAVVAFTTNIRSGCTPLTVTLINQSSGDFASVRWSLAGAEEPEATTDTVRAVYREEGRFPVVLTLIGALGTDTLATDTIEVFGTPEAAFRSEIVGDSVLFFDESVGTVTGWFWDFGDGATSTEQNPVHAYDTSGNYTVTLTAVRGGCANTEIVVVESVIGTSIPTLAELGVRLFPNPARTWLRLDGPGSFGPVRMLDGRMVLAGSGRELDVRGLPMGVYLIEVRTGDRIGVGRVVISH